MYSCTYTHHVHIRTLSCTYMHIRRDNDTHTIEHAHLVQGNTSWSNHLLSDTWASSASVCVQDNSNESSPVMYSSYMIVCLYMLSTLYPWLSIACMCIPQQSWHPPKAGFVQFLSIVQMACHATTYYCYHTLWPRWKYMLGMPTPTYLVSGLLSLHCNQQTKFNLILR